MPKFKYVISALSIGALLASTNLALSSPNGNPTSTFAGPAVKAGHSKKKRKPTGIAKKKKSAPASTENKQTPSGGQPGGGAGKS